MLETQLLGNFLFINKLIKWLVISAVVRALGQYTVLNTFLAVCRVGKAINEWAEKWVLMQWLEIKRIPAN